VLRLDFQPLTDLPGCPAQNGHHRVHAARCVVIGFDRGSYGLALNDGAARSA
jgi:hypothetical protein